jgi:hypothetical protein
MDENTTKIYLKKPYEFAISKEAMRRSSSHG